ncbi:MAG: hypothetical protein M1819_001020 [Sarea resinae]|nr:MAG: hypothetical protein M1819_001020 [Sarea resinae]
MANPESKSYLSAGINAISPWGSRSATPKPGLTHGLGGEGGLGKQQGGDHTISHSHRLSSKRYPRDCPPLTVKWFYAVDVPKRKPLPPTQPPKDAKPPPAPKKYVTFSAHDSRSIESAFQKLAEEEDNREPRSGQAESEVGGDLSTQGDPGAKQNTSINEPSHDGQARGVKVPVNEDYLFDVDIERRELGPVYWLGPIYEVRRGTWFYQEGSTQRPCDENLATQLEEGYLKVKPWRDANQPRQRSASQTRPRQRSLKDEKESKSSAAERPSTPVTPTASSDNPKSYDDSTGGGQKDGPNPHQAQLPTYRLFGTYMNSVVTYQDATVAWMLTDDFLSRMSSTVYQRFAGGGHLGGIKLVRGYKEPTKGKENKDGKPDNEKDQVDVSKESPRPDRDPKTELKFKRRSAPPAMSSSESTDNLAKAELEGEPEDRRQALERNMSNFVSSAELEDPEKQEEELRKRDEKEIRDDYLDQESGEQGREIEHLLLVTHGIGQRLGLRMESVNFVHDVNILRKTLKGVYGSSADLQALNSEIDKLPKNSRVQVLPVCWRHLLDFPKESMRLKKKEYDLGDSASLDDDEIYPSLEDITVEGVPAVRGLITDLALDVLLYQSAYKQPISEIVLKECNRIYHLFMERNPDFKGKVSLVGHSLGSAIMFDLLCQQKPDKPQTVPGHKKHHSRDIKPRSEKHSLKLDFDVENLFCLGSPVGLFQMLKGQTIAARQAFDTNTAEDPRDPNLIDDPFLAASGDAGKGAAKSSTITPVPLTVSSPKCQQLFNIFHPTDPISYRMEPLISPTMASLKPQPLPYTKKGIFGAPMGQGLTGIGARVGQSVSGLWSSFSSGIASSLLNRSLGITGEEVRESQSGHQPSNAQAQQSRIPLSMGAGTNISGGVISPDGLSPPPEVSGDAKKRQLAQDTLSAERIGDHPPTLIDAEIETLFAGFQKRRKSQQETEGGVVEEQDDEWRAAEEKGKKLRREEGKVRALNSNGRVDYSIQEGVFDISLIASIASHLSYWSDEDVSHFVISQLLSRNATFNPPRSSSR